MASEHALTGILPPSVLAYPTQFHAYGKDSQAAMREVTERVRVIDEHMSSYRKDSEISAVNRAAGHGAVDVSADTFFVIKRALQYAEETSGCMDITIAPILRLWNEAERHNEVPDNRLLGQTLRLVNYKDVLLSTGRFQVRLNYEGQAIDLGSVVKGYAADEVRKILHKHGVQSALIDLGGSVVALGSRPNGQLWDIPIRCPQDGATQIFGTLKASECSVVTAGAGRRPVIDTKSGHPVESGLRSVTVVAESAVDAEAIAFSALLLGPEQSKNLVEDKGVEAIMVTEQGMVSVTDGLKSTFSLTKGHALPDHRQLP
ncbi:MAG TPA: hypothetical protein DEP42_02355 [Ruminococcaceae bacterium]|nr:hypothetical protein [Oscillospiraceae bacterium]